MSPYKMPERTTDLFKLYMFIEKLNGPIAGILKENPDIDYFPLEDKEDFLLYIEKKKDSFYLGVKTTVNEKEMAFRVKLSKSPYAINKTVANNVKCQLYKRFNGAHADIYRDSLYEAIEAGLVDKVRTAIFNTHHFGKTKTETGCIDLTNPFGVLIDVEIKKVCKYKFIRNGFIITFRRLVYGLGIDEYTIDLTGKGNATTEKLVEKLNEIKGLL